MTVQTFGVAAIRAAIQRNLELAEFAEALIRSRAELALIAPATLGIVCFRREWPGCDEAETERRGLALMDSLERSGAALVSSTRLAGRHVVRMCILNPASSEDHIRRVIELAIAPTSPPQPEPRLYRGTHRRLRHLPGNRHSPRVRSQRDHNQERFRILPPAAPELRQALATIDHAIAGYVTSARLGKAV